MWDQNVVWIFYLEQLHKNCLVDTYVYFPANSSLKEGYDVRVFPRATECVKSTVGAVIKKKHETFTKLYITIQDGYLPAQMAAISFPFDSNDFRTSPNLVDPDMALDPPRPPGRAMASKSSYSNGKIEVWEQVQA